MRAAVVHTYGEPEGVVVEEIDRHVVLAPGTARVAVRAAAVNYPDLLRIADTYQVSIPLPFVPGSEFSGTVVDVAPDVGNVRVGDAVIGVTTHGAFAEETVLEAWRLTRLPAGIDWRQAAAFGVTYTTCYHALRTFAHVRPDNWVVVLGAAGGIGLAAVDIAVAMGTRVLAAASSEEKLAVARAAGAEATVNYATEDLKKRIKEITGAGADVVLDPVGGPAAEQSLRALRWGGRYVVVGFASGEIPRIPLNLVLLKGVVITGFENRTIMTHLPEVAPKHRAEVFDLLATGRLRPRIGGVYPLDDVARALREVADRRAIGKILVDVAASPVATPIAVEEP
ncbi:NADPH:quinone oxidoreductase family protein [Parafrankia elaeagni]|uniref:NADPH:quinone oxidoreductase family protein n=1 Tax=Parafrankia elaeagni TaxID=222534 RepID=UPI0003A42FB3|nr:NADPH:quinone oxidoreductase family protein [Parafrankia elaeagni]